MPNHNHEQRSSHNFQATPFENLRFQQPLEAGKPFAIDTSRSIDDTDGQPVAHLVAAIGANKDPIDFKTMDIHSDRTPDAFFLIDIRDLPIKRQVSYIAGQEKHSQYREYDGRIIDAHAHFILQGPSGSDPKATGWMGIYPGDAIQLGRTDPKTGRAFGLSDTTSRQHFSLEYNVSHEMIITDNNSTAGTNVGSANQLRPHTPHHQRRQQYRQHQNNNHDNRRRFTPPQQPPRQPNPAQELRDFITPGRGNEQVLRVGEQTADFLISEVDNLRREGVEDRKIMKRMAKKYHPDLAPAGPDRERNDQIMKAVGRLLDK